MLKKAIICILALGASVSVASAAPTIADIQKMLDQYAERVKVLEAENAVLREAVARAGIKIPLSAYSGAIYTTGTIVPTSPVVVAPPVVSQNEIATALKNIETTYGSVYAGFIGRIMNEWDKIRPAYKMPDGAVIGGYEFVETGAMDHVFVDIIYTGATLSGSYDAKLLYKFDKSTYARTLVGFFEFNPKTGFYITRSGSNPFAGAKRLFISDFRLKYALVPNTATSTATDSGATVVTPPTPPTSTNVGSVTVQDIKNAYSAERYLSAITLSDSWLANNAPTLEVLQIRYRVYFAIAKYAEALKEIEKVKSIGQLSSSVACEAYVIASYAKDTPTMNTYKPLCK